MGEAVLMTVLDLAAATGGDVFVPASGALDAAFSTVQIDSRKVAPGSLFVALIGTERDGHDFLASAFASGASAALVCGSRSESAKAAAEKAGVPIVIVPETLKGLQHAAAAYLDKFPRLLKVGITGSAGKTTTKELAAAMIGKSFRTVMNVGNLNSETGLPLSAFTVRAEHEVGVFEMGMNRRGEIAELAAVLRPRVALITNVGTAHIGILGTRDAIAEEKKELFSRFSGDELGFVPEDDAYAAFLAEGALGTIRRYGPSSLPAFGGARPLGLDGTEIVWDGIPAVLPLPGAHNLKNALAAAAIAEAVGASAADIRAAISEAKPLFGRAEVFRGPITVVRDCYNANPEAMEAAIDFCDSVEWKGRRLYVIGAMRELGVLSAEGHRELGKRLARSRADTVFLFGPETADAEAAIGASKRTLRFDNIDELSAALGAEAAEGDFVLLKGSRGTALERLTDILAKGA